MNVLNTQFQTIKLSQLQEITGLSRSSIYDRMNQKSPRYDSNFPKPIKFGHSARWRLSEIETWIKARIAERDQITSVS